MTTTAKEIYTELIKSGIILAINKKDAPLK